MSDPNTSTDFDYLQASILKNWLLRERLNAFNTLGISVLISGSLAFYLWILSSKELQGGIFWLLMACLGTLLLFLVLKAKARNSVSLLSFLTALLSLAWGAGMLALTKSQGETWTTYVGLLMLLNFSLPWRVWQQIVLASLHLLSVFALGLQFPQFLGLAALALLAVVSLRNSGAARLRFLSDISIVDYLRLCEAVNSESLIKTLGMELSLLSRVLVIYGNERAEIFENGFISQDRSESIYYRGLWQRSMDQEFHDAVFTRAELGADFIPALEGWFGSVPERVMVFRAIHLKHEREEQILIVAPAMQWFSLVGFRRVFHELSYVVSVFRTGLQIMRTRALSSGLLSETQHSISEQEYEVHELIHHVNNMAQDISIICANSQDSLALPGAADKEALKASLKRIEIGARALSYEVSDLKIERELDKSLANFPLEQRDFSGLMDDFSVYASHRAFRKGMQVLVTNRVETGRIVKVCSGEYFGTALRGLLRYLEAQLPKGGKINVESSLVDQQIKIELSDNGSIRALDFESAEQLPAPIRRISEFVNACGGAMLQEKPGPQFNNVIALGLSSSLSSALPRRSGAQWVLFVDDDSEISVFYERVAGALNLEAHTAASCAEARKMLDDLGRPRILITDLELQDGSGVDIIRYARSLFGADLPVIVVSGHSEGQRFDEAKLEGYARFLVKPVGRKKLFAEIQSVLAK